MCEWRAPCRLSIYRLLILASMFLFSFYPVQVAATVATMTAQEILHAADEARGNLNGVTWQLHMHTETSRGSQEMTLDVQARGFDVVAIARTPPRSRGDRLILFQNNMWFYKPGLSKPVPISRRQKLMGSASYGDVATTNYANDYQATLLGEEMVEGVPCLVYDLTALHGQVTYDRIKYWIDRERLVGIKAEYFTVSGQIFKSARMEYENHVQRGGALKPFISRIVIRGELVSEDKTTLSFSAPTLVEIPDSVFNLNLLRQ